MKHTILNTAVLIFLFFAGSDLAAYVRPDAFMHFGFDASATAFANANIATYPGPDAVLRNPAILTQIQTKVLDLGYVRPFGAFLDETRSISGLNYFSGAFAARTSKNVTMAGALNYMGVLDAPRTDANANQTGLFNAYYLGGLFGFGYYYSPKLSVGAAVKTFLLRMDNQSFYLFPTINAGATYSMSPGINLGFKFDNIVPSKISGYTIAQALEAGIAARKSILEFYAKARLEKLKMYEAIGMTVYFPKINFLAGYETYTNSLNLGFDWNLSSIELEYTLSIPELLSNFSPVHYVSIVLWY